MNDEKEGTDQKNEALIDALKLYGRRMALRNKLEQIHAAMPSEPTVQAQSQDQSQGKVVAMPVPWKKYLTISAVAASVSIVTVLATLWVQEAGKAYAPGPYVTLGRENAKVEKQAAQQLHASESSNKVSVKPAHYTGTGFLISAQGYAVTSYHVVKDADSVYLENEKFGSLRARVVHSDPLNDVSIVQIVSGSWKPRRVPYVLSLGEAALGEKVYTLGFPREDVVFGEGAISASSGYNQDHNAYQVSIPVNPGNSGGPLLNERGELIGIIAGFQSRVQGAAFATKSQAIIEAVKAPELDTLRKAIVLPQRNGLQTANRVQQIQRLKEFVFMVRVYKN